jgi:hypothetical protein
MKSEKLKKSVIEKATKASGRLLISESMKEIDKLLLSYPLNIELLHARASLFEKQQHWANAINDYLKILGIDQKDQKAQTRVEMLKTILRYNNTDIYSSPNTHYDPWFE